MASMNQVELIGNTTRDPELQYIGENNRAVAVVGVAMNFHYGSKEEGNYKEEVTYVDVKAWGRQAEILAQYAPKGKQIAVVGRLTQDRWEDKETGQKKSKVYVTANQIILLGGRDGEAQKQDEDVPGVDL